MEQINEKTIGELEDYFSELVNSHRDLLLRLYDLENEIRFVSLAIAKLEQSEGN